MKRVSLLLVAVSACAALAEIGWKNGGTTAGPVQNVNCSADGGLYCTRNSTASRGDIRCTGATATEPGCITPSAQTLAGDKTWTGFQRLVGVVHGSLVACDVSHKNMMQGCTTHGAPVWCNGTSNIELLGSTQPEQTLFTLDVQGIPPLIMGGATVPSTNGWSISALQGFIGNGSGSGTLRITVTGTAGACNCDVGCGISYTRVSCTGSCSYAASSSLIFTRSYVSNLPCDIDPHATGSLSLVGVPQ